MPSSEVNNNCLTHRAMVLLLLLLITISSSIIIIIIMIAGSFKAGELRQTFDELNGAAWRRLRRLEGALVEAARLDWQLAPLDV